MIFKRTLTKCNKQVNNNLGFGKNILQLLILVEENKFIAIWIFFMLLSKLGLNN